MPLLHYLALILYGFQNLIYNVKINKQADMSRRITLILGNINYFFSYKLNLHNWQMQDVFLIVANMIKKWFKAKVTERGISALAIAEILHSLGITWGELNKKSNKREKNLSNRWS